VNLTIGESRTSKSPEARRVAVTEQVVARFALRVLPCSVQPVPVTENEMRPVPDPPVAVRLIVLLFFTRVTVLLIFNGACCKAVNENVCALELVVVKIPLAALVAVTAQLPMFVVLSTPPVMEHPVPVTW
jgi:hypothetical protein